MTKIGIKKCQLLFAKHLLQFCHKLMTKIVKNKCQKILSFFIAKNVKYFYEKCQVVLTVLRTES